MQVGERAGSLKPETGRDSSISGCNEVLHGREGVLWGYSPPCHDNL